MEPTTKPASLSRAQRLALLGSDHADTTITDADARRANLSRALARRDVSDVFAESVAIVEAARAQHRADANADGLDVWA